MVEEILKNLHLLIGIICVFLLIKSLFRLNKDVKQLFFQNDIKDETISNLNDTEKDMIIERVCFSRLSREQKFSYICTIESFLTFADNIKEEIIERKQDEDDSLQIAMTENLCQYVLKLLSMTPDEIDDAISFFDDQFWRKPQDYLKEIDDHLVLDSLLYVCAKIADTKRGEYNGHDIHKAAKDFLFCYFGELGYTPDKIKQTLLKINSYESWTTIKS